MGAGSVMEPSSSSSGEISTSVLSLSVLNKTRHSRHDGGRLSSLARVCEDGKMVVKRTKDITAAEFKLSERNSREKGELWLSLTWKLLLIIITDCTWYGEAFCHGDEVIVSFYLYFKTTKLI